MHRGLCQVDARVTDRDQDLARDRGAAPQPENAARRHQQPEYQEIPHARHAGISGRHADGGHRQQRSREGEQEDGGPEPKPVTPAQHVLDGPRVIRFVNARSPRNDATCPRLQRFDASHRPAPRRG